KSRTEDEVQNLVVLKKTVMECFKDHKDVLIEHDAKIQKIEEIITEWQEMKIGKMKKHFYISRTPSGKRLKLDLPEKVCQMESFIIYMAFITLIVIIIVLNSSYTEKWK